MSDHEMDVDEPVAVPATDKDASIPSSKIEGMQTRANATAVRSIEGWIIIVTNVNEEADEEALQDIFGEFGEIKNLHMNLDRRSGYVKGYVLIEYATLSEARAAIDGTDKTKFLDQIIRVDYAFVRAPNDMPRNPAEDEFERGALDDSNGGSDDRGYARNGGGGRRRGDGYERRDYGGGGGGGGGRREAYDGRRKGDGTRYRGGEDRNRGGRSQSPDARKDRERDEGSDEEL